MQENRKYRLPELHEARDSQVTYEPASSFEEKSRIFPNLKQANISIERIVARKNQPISGKIFREVK